jgi:hypothetical protein
MGIETAALVVAAVATVGESVAEVKAASERQHALDLQLKESKLKTQQKTLSNYDVLKKVTDAQIAHQTVTGTAFSSPSFNAIQRQTLNVGAKQQQNTDIEGGFEEKNLKIEKENVRNSLYAQLFGNAAQLSSTAFSVYSKMPKKGA